MPTSSSNGFLLPDGTPNLPLLTETFNRCAPAISGGTQWMDNQRFCRWPGQNPDGRKHDNPGDPNGAALPWNGASDSRPFTIDDVINERVAMLNEAFWRAMIQQMGSAGESEESGYAVALVEWLLFTKFPQMFLDEVELSSNYQETYGWCLLAPRWKREVGIKRLTLTMAMIRDVSGQAVASLQASQAAAQSPDGEATMQNSPDPLLVQMAQLPQLILDPSLEDQAVAAMQAWYDSYVQQSIPADLRDQVPATTPKLARKVVQALRQGLPGTAPLPHLARNELVISALKPWEEAFLPPELTTVNEVVFQVERISEAELMGRQTAMGYNPDWVTEALTKKGQWSSPLLPVGTPLGVQGNLGGGAVPVQTPGTTSLDGRTGPIEIIYAVFRAADEDGIPGVYCTTFHRAIAAGKDHQPLYAKHELVESIGGDLPYTPCVREKWARSIASSRGVPEMAFTQQNLVKGFEDALADRASITVLPPVNVYESPLETNYEFGPARKNYCRLGREPKFMEGMPSGAGLGEGLEVRNMIKQGVDNRFAMLSDNVPATRQQTAQAKSVRRFLMAWTQAIRQGLCLIQQHMEDAEFAEITGAPAGWLEQRRLQPNVLACSLDFDVRELDPELMLKRIEAMNKIALPNDILGVIQRAKWAVLMARTILGPTTAKLIVQPQDDASQALLNKAKNEVLQMFAGNPPNFVDDKDPTAPSLLKFTQQIVQSNPTYLRALNDEALAAVVGQNAPQVVQQLGERRPDDAFSKLLLKWLENLKFVGVTQVNNKQIGRIGVDPAAQ